MAVLWVAASLDCVNMNSESFGKGSSWPQMAVMVDTSQEVELLDCLVWYLLVLSLSASMASMRSLLGSFAAVGLLRVLGFGDGRFEDSNVVDTVLCTVFGDFCTGVIRGIGLGSDKGKFFVVIVLIGGDSGVVIPKGRMEFGFVLSSVE